ncbi:MAG: hypothetical protein IIX41_05910, partial [Bacteroidales bacterium]|nr:hypothetical protein [Bacteroidales bacterium]
MLPPAGQENALQPARRVLWRHLEKEKVSKSAWNGNAAAAGQKNALQPARKVLRRRLGQEKVSKSARNGNAAACRAER